MNQHTPDLEEFSLSNFLNQLGDPHFTSQEHPQHLSEIAALLEGNPKAVLFKHIHDSPYSLCGNVAGSRERIAQAFHTDKEKLLFEVVERLKKPGELVPVDSALAPVHQVILQGEECDLTQLPIHLQHGLDGAPYISSSMDVVMDPNTGWTNVGIRRLMVTGRRKAGVDLVAPSDLRAIYIEQARAGHRVPVSFVIGSSPVDHVAATMRIPTDELKLLSALRGKPLGVVKCVTNDLWVPADAQMILEGYLDEHGHTTEEGPYGEFLGYYGGVKKNPVFHLTAITHRKNCIFQTSTISGAEMSKTDTAQLSALRTEVVVARALEIAVREVKAVYADPASGGTFNVRVAIKQRVPGEAKSAIAAVFACMANVKHVYVVDPDIDIFSSEQMEWAMATRFQADKDMVFASGFRAMPLDPSLQEAKTTAKLGFDLTLPFQFGDQARPMNYRVPKAPSYGGKQFASLEAALLDGPKFFEELMAALRSKDGREVIRWLEDHESALRIARDPEGRYLFKK
jgi:2,5-furandicarboxylate decarboxylase 1